MLFLETLNIGKPSDRISKCSNRELNQNILIAAIIVMAENRNFIPKNLNPEPDIKTLGTTDRRLP
jgi:hypothetical protein